MFFGPLVGICVARSGMVGRCQGVLVVADVVAPTDDAPLVVGLLHGDVGHEPGRRGAMPVILARLEEDPVARLDDLDRAAAALAQANSLRDPDRLAMRVGMPRCPRTRREVDASRAQARTFRRSREGSMNTVPVNQSLGPGVVSMLFLVICIGCDPCPPTGNGRSGTATRTQRHAARDAQVSER